MFARLSPKGQVTIPRKIREKLKINRGGGVLFVMEGDDVKMKGVPGESADKLAGSLKKYAKEHASLNVIRKKVQHDIAAEIASKDLSD